MKRSIALLLAISLLASLCACGGQPQEPPEDPAPAVSAPAVTEDPNLGHYWTAWTWGLTANGWNCSLREKPCSFWEAKPMRPAGP